MFNIPDNTPNLLLKSNLSVAPSAISLPELHIILNVYYSIVRNYAGLATDTMHRTHLANCARRRQIVFDGLVAIGRIFLILLLYTKNIAVVRDQCMMYSLYYLEFNEHILLKTTNNIVQIENIDSINYIYAKSIGDLSPNCIRQSTSHQINEMFSTQLPKYIKTSNDLGYMFIVGHRGEDCATAPPDAAGADIRKLRTFPYGFFICLTNNLIMENVGRFIQVFFDHAEKNPADFVPGSDAVHRLFDRAHDDCLTQHANHSNYTARAIKIVERLDYLSENKADKIIWLLKKISVDEWVEWVLSSHQ